MILKKKLFDQKKRSVPTAETVNQYRTFILDPGNAVRQALCRRHAQQGKAEQEYRAHGAASEDRFRLSEKFRTRQPRFGNRMSGALSSELLA